MNRYKYTERQSNGFGLLRKVLPVFAILFALFLPLRLFPQTFNPLISFSVEACTLDAALEKLFADYELNVAFNKAEMSKIRIEGYSCSYKSVEEVLADLLKGTGYGFKKVGKQYVVKREKQVPPLVPPDDENPEQTSVAVSVKETVEHKLDTIGKHGSDTVRIIDTVRVVATVMRYDTVVRVEQVEKTDTVYAEKYKGLAIKWPEFKDNGWFVSPSVSVGFLRLKQDVADGQGDVGTSPRSDMLAGIDAGHKSGRWSAGMSLSYRALSYRFSFDQVVSEGDYYENDTIDSYYVVQSGHADTIWHYILDSTYIPLTTTHYSYRDLNRLDYLGIGVFATFDFLRMAHSRMFVRGGASIDFLLSQAGSTSCGEVPFHTEIGKEAVNPVRFAYQIGLGAAFKVGQRIELAPELQRQAMVGPLYVDGFPCQVRASSWHVRFGLTYYF